jgi:hypothetical protein
MVFGAGKAQGRIDLLNTRLCGVKLIGPGSGVKVTRDSPSQGQFQHIN